MRATIPRSLLIVAVVAATGCADHPTTPSEIGPARTILSHAPARQSKAPPFGFIVRLRGVGSGIVQFRQPKDDARIVFLDVMIHGLAPNAVYQFQRETDTVLDAECTGGNWLTLGREATPLSITTDDRGVGRAEFFRDLSAIPGGSMFDIRFRVLDAVTQDAVLKSTCEPYTLRG